MDKALPCFENRSAAEPVGDPVAVVRWGKDLREYSLHLTIDTNTVSRNLKLSENSRRATHAEDLQPYPDHPDRFDGWMQLLCKNPLAGRCFWEVEWSGEVDVSVSYRRIRRTGGIKDCRFGWNDHSWSLTCSDQHGYSLRHNIHATDIFPPADSNRVAVCVDCPAGILSFFKVGPDSVVHLHTEYTSFTEPLYAGFWIGPASSVFLCSDKRLEFEATSSSRDVGVQAEASNDQMSEPEAGTSGTDDKTELKEAPSTFTPEEETLHSQVLYRFQCPGPGVFRCTLTGLVFVMTQEAKLWYTIIQWDELILQPAGKVPAGPLYSIRCSTGAVCQLRLPHAETGDVPSIQDLLSVAHFSDADGLSLIPPLRITDTHVVVEISDLSAFGLVWDYIKRFIERKDPVASQVLLYLGPVNLKGHNQKLYVFLLPRNIPIHQVSKDQKDCQYVRSTSNCKLIREQSYSLVCPRAPQSYKIQPKRAEFDLNFGDQYHPTFEIRLPLSTEEVAISIRDEAEAAVWEYDVDLTGPDPPNVRVQSESPSLKKKLLGVLEELTKNDFDKFKWFLKDQSQSLHGRFRECELSAAPPQGVVDLLLQRCGPEEAATVMRTTLGSIGRNDLVERI